jgi:hypothetical protein
VGDPGPVRSKETKKISFHRVLARSVENVAVMVAHDSKNKKEKPSTPQPKNKRETFYIVCCCVVYSSVTRTGNEAIYQTL